MGKPSRSNSSESGKKQSTSKKDKITTGNVEETSLESKWMKMVEKEVDAWKQEYLKEIKKVQGELTEVKCSQQFINKQYEDLTKDYKKLQETNRSQDNEIKFLKSQSDDLMMKGNKDADKIDALEQYGRRQNLEVVGIMKKSTKTPTR